MAEPRSTIKFQGQTFEYVRLPGGVVRDLCWKGHSFDPDPAKFMPAGHLTKKGTVRKNKRRLISKPIEYWKAQLLFRGLLIKGLTSVVETQDALRGNEKLGKLKELVDIQKGLEIEWVEYERKEEERAVEREKLLDKQAEETLKEKLDEKSGDRVIIVRSWELDRVKAAADKLKLFSAFALRPTETKSLHMAELWETYECLVISRDRSCLQRKLAEIAHEDRNTRKEIVERRERRNQEMEEERERKLKQELKHMQDQMLAFSKKNKGAWDVTGKWRIECPYIAKEWGESCGKGKELGSEGMGMEIFITSSGRQKEMWAKFEFSLMEGIFRFLRLETPTPAAKKGNSSNPPIPTKRKRTDDNDEDEELDRDKHDYSDSDEEEEYIPDFKIPSTSHPSSKNPIWRYRYRCRDTGEGEISLGEDENIYEITFGGVAGEKLSGTIQSTYFREIPFTGYKVGESGVPRSSVAREWNRLNERAYDRESRRRWGGW